MKFKIIKEGCDNVMAYGQPGKSTGDTVDLTGHLAEKALTNPAYELVSVVKATKRAVKKAVKK